MPRVNFWMAATLDRDTGVMLPPKGKWNEDGEEEDPRAELGQKLLNTRCGKYMSFELRDRQVDAARTCTESRDFRRKWKLQTAHRLRRTHRRYESEMLQEIFRSIKEAGGQDSTLGRSQYGNIEKDEVDMDIKMLYVEAYAREHKTFSFRKL